ncbi:MAG: MATE family efflux transporter [Clostridia bacterium]|nr:MATE family efflux transporter [Clostridia bacterium]
MAKNYNMDMTEGKLFGKIAIFSLPIMFSAILQLLFNAADTIVVGQFAGDTSLAAVGSNGPITALFVNLFVGLSVGTNVIVAQAMGAKDERQAKDATHTSILFSLIAGCVLAIIGFFASRTVLELMDTPSDVIDKSTLYLKIFFLGMPANMLFNYANAVMRAYW